MPPLLVDGADPAALDGADRFRQQLVADLDELLREHHLQMAQHVEQTMGKLCTQLQLAQPRRTRLSSSVADDIHKRMGRCSANVERRTRRTTQVEAPVAVQEVGRNTGADLASEAPRSKRPTVRIEESSGGKHRKSADTFDSSDNAAELGEDISRHTSKVARVLSDAYNGDMAKRWKKAVEHSASRSSQVNEISGPLGAGGCRGKIRDVVDSPIFEAFTCALIVSNSIFFGIETQFMAMGVEPGSFEHIASVYTVIFACELILRAVAAGKDFFLHEHWLWNVIDTFVVATSLVESALQAATPSGGSANLTCVRLIRVARIVRIFRVIRVFHAFASLRILLHCVIHTLRSLMWTMVLLMGILYIFGILFTQAASEALSSGSGHLTDMADQQHYEALKRYYGGLQWAIFTLFKAVTNGVSWQEVSAPLAFVHPVWEFLFTVFISFTYFAVLNVVTGVFCQSAIESAASDKDMVLQAQLADKKIYTEQLRELFDIIDANHTGQVDFVMLESCLTDPKCQAYFEVLGITSDDAWNLFMLLDDDDSDQINLEEFVSGCLRLRGASRSIDSHMLLYESRWTMKKIGSLFKAFNELLEHLSSDEATSVPQPVAAKKYSHVDAQLEHYEF